MKLQIMKNKNTINSREVAEMVDKRHSDLIRDIETYVGYISENAELRSQDFFTESSYKTQGNNKTYKCYELTKQGCEMVANKLTGKKGIQFTALYVKKFNEMEQGENSQATHEIERMKAEAKLNNSKRMIANTYFKLSNVETLSKEYQNILVAQAAETLSGKKILPHVASVQKTYSATELGNKFGVSAQKICSITNKYNLKTDEYGEWYRDKSRYSSKEVDSFRYYDAIIPRLEALLV